MLLLDTGRWLVRRFQALPDTVAMGLLVLAIGGVADVFVHVLETPFLVLGGVNRSEVVAHGLVVTGMALTSVGVAISALGRLRPVSAADERSRRDTDL